jgi:HD domain
MNSGKLRKQIAWDAARLMYTQQESEYFRAKQKAARRIARGWVKPSDLPSNAEIRDEVLAMARLLEGDKQRENLRDMRFSALRVMKLLHRFRPRLIGSVLTGHIHHASDIDLHIFSDSVEAVAMLLEDEMMQFDIERKQVRKDGESTTYTHIHIKDTYPIELTIYGTDKISYTFKSSITGKAIERASIAQLEEFLATEYPEVEIEQVLQAAIDSPDRFQVYHSLLLPLENVKQHPKYHPEGDVLYHSLQVFDLARNELPYDEEFLLAALLHDIGKGIDNTRHVESGLEALDGYITERTQWLIGNHMVAHGLLDGTIGSRARRRLQENESFDELVMLAECDRDGRVPGVETPELEDAIDYLRELSLNFD